MHRWFSSLESLFAVLSLLIVLGGSAQAASPPLILVSIDGYRADYLDRGHSPVLEALATHGVHAEALRPVFPSLTYPNHYTLVTGLYPDQHGIVNNAMHDPVLGNFSPSNRAANIDGRWWDQAEPLWITAEKQGLRTASVFYPGTQAEIHGARPSYWQLFDSSVQPNARVDQALAWLDLPTDQRPAFISLYLEQADVAGHNYGPESMQLDEALVTVDSALGRLVEGLRQRGLFDTTNLVVLSDHGMSATSADRIVLLDKFVNVDHIELVSSLVNVGINPKPGYEDEVAHALIAQHPHLKCWQKGRLPKKYHYGSNARIPAIACLTEDGWITTTAAIASKVTHAPLGEHGYENSGPKMRALFVAHGPAFKQHLTVPAFDNIHVYAMLAKLLGVTPKANEGRLAVTAGMLRAADGSGTMDK